MVKRQRGSNRGGGAFNIGGKPGTAGPSITEPWIKIGRGAEAKRVWGFWGGLVPRGHRKNSLRRAGGGRKNLGMWGLGGGLHKVMLSRGNEKNGKEKNQGSSVTWSKKKGGECRPFNGVFNQIRKIKRRGGKRGRGEKQIRKALNQRRPPRKGPSGKKIRRQEKGRGEKLKQGKPWTRKDFLR